MHMELLPDHSWESVTLGITGEGFSSGWMSRARAPSIGVALLFLYVWVLLLRYDELFRVTICIDVS